MACGAAPKPQVRNLKLPPDRLYGRVKGHKLRPRQQRLLELALPRLLITPDHDPRAAFGLPKVWLEVGFGSGEHAQMLAATHPEAGVIACEVFENGICSLLSRLVPEGEEATAPLPANLRIWPDDARRLLAQLPDACLERLLLMFPDPWPKARHAKRRFVHPVMLPTLARVLKPDAEWRVASDDPTYQAWVAEVMATTALFRLTEAHATRPADWPPTRYEAKALREGRSPIYWRFIRSG